MSENRYYPAFLDLSGKLCLVVGGGKIARRKIESLLEARARVRVVAPHLTEHLVGLAQQNMIEWVEDTYRREHLRGVWLVIGATASGDVNDRIAGDATDERIFVNIVDVPDRCSFIVPAVHSDNSLKVAVSTGGAAPKLAGSVRDMLAGAIAPEYSCLIGLLGEHRPRIRQLSPEKKRAFWKHVQEMDISTCRGEQDELASMVQRLIRHYEAAEKGTT